MKAHQLLLAFSCFIYLSVLSTPLPAQSFFEREYFPDCNLNQLIETPDGGLLGVGRGNNWEDLCLLRLAPNGDSLWYREHSFLPQVSFADAIQKPNGNIYLLAGQQNLQGNDLQLILECDSFGSQTNFFQHTDSVNGRIPKNLFTLSNADLGVWGNIDSSSQAADDYPYFLEIDNLGNILNDRRFRNLPPIRQAIALNGGGYALLSQHHYTNLQGYPIYGPVILHMDASFNLSWTYTYHDSLPCSISHLCEGPSGELYLAGSRNNTYLPVTEPGYQAAFIKLASNGTQLWIREHNPSPWNGENSYAERIRLNAGGGYAFMGGTQSYQTTNNSMILAEIDSAGSLLWSREFRIGQTYTQDMITLSDGGYALSCDQSSFPNSAQVVIRTDSLGVGRGSAAPIEPFNIYPNPSAGLFRIQGNFSGENFKVWNAQGKVLRQGKLSPNGPTGLDLRNVPKGIYLLRISNEKGDSQTHRLILQ